MRGGGFIRIRVEIIRCRLSTGSRVIGKDGQIWLCRSPFTSFRLLNLEAEVYNAQKFSASLAVGQDVAPFKCPVTRAGGGCGGFKRRSQGSYHRTAS